MSNEVPPGIIVSGTLQRQAWIDRVLPPVEMVRPGLWSIPTPFPNSPLRYVLTYAVAYDGGVALVDTGWPCSEAWDGLSAGLRAAGWDLSDIKAVLITHGHGDHMGLARRLREHTGAWVAMHEADTGARQQFPDRETFKRANDETLRKRGGLDADFAAAAVAAGSRCRTTSPSSRWSRTGSWSTASGRSAPVARWSRCTRPVTPRGTCASTTATATWC